MTTPTSERTARPTSSRSAARRPAAEAPSQAPSARLRPEGASATGRLRRIHEAAAETGLTPRAIRYYEELGLLRPAARSDGAYRLYDDDDLERLRFIKGLRDDAGFSLAEIAQLLEDEAARLRNRARFEATHDAGERRAIVQDALARADRQVELLRRKASRLAEMIAAAEARRAHLLEHLAELDREAEANPGGPPDRAAEAQPGGPPDREAAAEPRPAPRRAP
ncbi:MAG TPA: MerR family transcriptional regulator [Candidatus Binatia bacterium]|nr:MerR family transcriptional regulator [Candidatus Binatia bacterium]